MSFSNVKRTAIKEFLLRHLDLPRKEIVERAMSGFAIPAQTVYRYLRELERDGVIESADGRHYRLASGGTGDSAGTEFPAAATGSYASAGSGTSVAGSAPDNTGSRGAASLAPGGILVPSHLKCEERFQEIYGKVPDGVTFSPYRICPIGAHSDHNLGKITGLAIDKGIHIAYRPKMNGVIEMASLQFPKRAQWHIREIGDKTGDWADYLRGATWALAKTHVLSVGLCGVIEGSLPIGGLSSSAAVILAFLDALCRVNGIRLAPQELIDTAFDAEKNYVGMNVGTLDQSCEVLSRKDHLLYLDCRDNSYELIPTSPAMKPYRIAIFFSGLEHSLAGSKYNMRVDELRAGVYALQAYAGMDYGKFAQANARDVSWEIYQTYKERLPETWARRCEHWYTEFRRVEAGAEAWRRGDIEEYGRLSFASGWSSIHNWESGAPEQIRLYEIMTETDGIYGGRFSGAGFKGCCMALIDPAKEDAVTERVTKEYLKSFPEMEGRYSVCICGSADGVMG